MQGCSQEGPRGGRPRSIQPRPPSLPSFKGIGCRGGTQSPDPNPNPNWMPRRNPKNEPNPTRRPILRGAKKARPATASVLPKKEEAGDAPNAAQSSDLVSGRTKKGSRPAPFVADHRLTMERCFQRKAAPKGRRPASALSLRPLSQARPLPEKPSRGPKLEAAENPPPPIGKFRHQVRPASAASRARVGKSLLLEDALRDTRGLSLTPAHRRARPAR